MLSLKNQTEGNLAEPEVDFVPVTAFLILEEGETAAAINITVLEVKLVIVLLLLLNLKCLHGSRTWWNILSVTEVVTLSDF